MSRFRQIILDCDGVLIDSEIVANRAVAELKTELGFPTTLEEQIERFVGLGASSPQVRDELARLPANYPALARERLWRAFERELKPMPGVVEALDRLESRGLRGCVASSSHPERIRHTLGLTGLLDRFEGRIFSGNEVSRGKPAPDLFLWVAHQMGWKPSECLVIEDSVAGVRGALAAGMTVLGFSGGSHFRTGGPERLRQAGATEVFSSWMETVDWIDTVRYRD